MAMILPGVSITETLLSAAAVDDPVTMPLFIAFTAADADIENTLQPIDVRSQAQATALFGSSGTLAYALRHFFDNQGQRCYVVSLGSNAQWADDSARLQALIAALQSSDLADVVAADKATGLLLVPEMSELNDVTVTDLPSALNDAPRVNYDSGTLWYQGWQAILQLCQPGQQRFALLELPDAPEQANALATGSFSASLCQNAAAWWPRLQTSYREGLKAANGLILSPLPAVAAAIQYSASEKGVWKAPANIQLLKTIQPVRNIMQSQALLNQNGVSCNVIRSFPGKGVRLWGCRTLLNDNSSPWRYIQLRLLMNSLETQLTRMTRAFLFEPANALTWTKIKGQVWTWLRQQWLAGAFYGTVEEDAFSVLIGLNETMTAEDIASGKMILKLQLALLAPAEFIDISLTLDRRDGSAMTEKGA